MPIDYSKRDPLWLSHVRPRIMKRANNKCEFCGLEHNSIVYSITMQVNENGRYKKRTIWFRDIRDSIRENTNGLPPKKVKVILTIAHLDHDENNFEVSDDRLKALCQICHLRLDSKEKYRRINNIFNVEL